MKRLLTTETAHHRITVDEADGTVSLRFNGCLQSSMSGEDGLGTLQMYLELFHIPFALHHDVRRVLVVGLGGGLLPKRIHHDYPDVSTDVVELDPDVIEISRRYFHLPEDDRLRIIPAEGRAYLSSTSRSYDVIIMDAYFESSMPYSLSTQECVGLCKSRLTDGGILAYNFVGVPQGQGSEPFRRFMKGLSASFDSTYVFAVKPDALGTRQNIVVLASDTALDAEHLRRRLASRGDGAVTIPRFERFAENLVAITPARGTRSLRDAEMPPDGLLHG